MTSREVIIANLNGGGAPRIGFAFGGGRRNDFCGCGLGPSKKRRPKRWEEGEFEYYDDEWGNIWFRVKTMSRGGEIHTPVLEDWSQLDEYGLPDMDDPARFERAREVFGQERDRFRVASLPGFPFAICRYMRKMEIYFQDLLLERERIDQLHEMVTSLLERVIVQFAQAGADGVFFCEDWGTQHRLLIHPSLWREIFKPLFQRLCGVAHDHGVKVLMHSCGNDRDILDDLAEVGIDALQFDQPALYGIEWLAAKLKALGVCLYAPVDIQRVLPTGDRERIELEARTMVELFGREGAGLIAKNYGDLKGIGVEQEWDTWAYEAFVASGGFERAHQSR